MFHSPPGVKTGSSSCHCLTAACDSEVIRSYEGSAQPFFSLSCLHFSPQGPPAAQLQLAVSGSLLSKEATWPLITAEFPGYCKSSISHQTQGLWANLQATWAFQLVSTEVLTSYLKGPSATNTALEFRFPEGSPAKGATTGELVPPCRTGNTNRA